MKKSVKLVIVLAVLGLLVFSTSKIIKITPRFVVMEMPEQEIRVDFSDEIQNVSEMLWGAGSAVGPDSTTVEGIQVPGEVEKLWNNNTGEFNQTLLNITKQMGFTNLRLGFSPDYDWRKSGSTETPEYQFGIEGWINYSKILGDLPMVWVLNVRNKTAEETIEETVKENVEFVKYINVKKNYNITYWEMGNEEWGFLNSTEYTDRAKENCQAIKEVDSRIKCGLVLFQLWWWPWGNSWNENVISLIEEGDMDFVILHFYRPHSHFNTVKFGEDCKEVSASISNAGNYNLAAIAMGDNAEMEISIDGFSQQFNVIPYDEAGHEYKKYTTSTVYLSEGKHNFKVCFANFDQSKVLNILYVVNKLELTDSAGSTQAIYLQNVEEWTYAFFASVRDIEKSITEVRNLLQEKGLNLPIFVTEYNFFYGVDAYNGWGSFGADWRSNVFVGLLMQALLRQGIEWADIWSNVENYYWRYVYDDGTKYPLFYTFTIFRYYTGDIIVNSTLVKPLNYDNQQFNWMPNYTNTPYLSVLSSKSSDNKKLYVNVINRHQTNSLLALVNLKGYSGEIENAIAYTLKGNSLESHPAPRAVDSKEVKTTNEVIQVDNNFIYSFPSYSITVIEIDIKEIIREEEREGDGIYKPQCSDGIDNDGDGFIDMEDIGCTSIDDNDEYNCIEKWQCTEWSECKEGKQTRTCTDLNNCGTIEEKPVEEQFCTEEEPLPLGKKDIELEFKKENLFWIIISFIIVLIGIIMLVRMIYIKKKWQKQF